MTKIPVLDHDRVLAAVSPADAIDRVRDAFVSFARGEWQMPPKIYLPSPPNGDFRAMPVRGEGLAILKWVTSFPVNPRRGLPTVTGVVLVSNADDGEPLAMLDARAVTALRTGAAAVVATQELAREDARTVGIVGCGLHGLWVGRCMADSEYGPGVCFDPDPDAAGDVAADLGWEVGDLSEALACDVVCTITPGAETVVTEADLRPGQHLNLLGADGPGKAEASVAGGRARARGGAPLLRRVGAGKPRRRADRRGRRGCRAARGRDGAGSGVRGARSRPRLGPRHHPVRLDGPRDPGPRDRPRRARGATGGRGEGPNRDAVALSLSPPIAPSSFSSSTLLSSPPP